MPFGRFTAVCHVPFLQGKVSPCPLCHRGLCGGVSCANVCLSGSFSHFHLGTLDVMVASRFPD